MTYGTHYKIDVTKVEAGYACAPLRDAVGAPERRGGIRTVIERLRTEAPARIALEATSGYELTVAATLAAAGLPVAMSTRTKRADGPWSRAS